MARSQTIERFFDSVEQTSSTLLEAVKDQNERQFRLSEAMLLEMQRVRHEDIEMGRRLIANPLDFGGLYRLFVDTMSKRQGRALEIGREVVGTLSDSATEARDTARKVISVQRVASEAATDTASRAVNAAAETARDGGAGATSAVERAMDDTRRNAGATARSVAQTTRATTDLTAERAVSAPARRARNGAGGAGKSRRGRSPRTGKARRNSAKGTTSRNGS